MAKLPCHPRGRHHEITRQWEIIRTLEHATYGKSIRALAEQAGVTQRTVRRDLEVLEAAGFALEQKTVAGGKRWQLDRRHFRGLLERGLSVSELCALYLSRAFVESFAGAPFREDLRSAFDKIDDALPTRLWRYVERLPSALAAKTEPAKIRSDNVPGYLTRLTDAVLEHKRVHMRYESFSSRAVKEYTVDPHRLLYAQGGIYLHAYVPIYGGMRTFAVERIRRLEVGPGIAHRAAAPACEVESQRRGDWHHTVAGACPRSSSGPGLLGTDRPAPEAGHELLRVDGRLDISEQDVARLYIRAVHVLVRIGVWPQRAPRQAHARKHALRPRVRENLRLHLRIGCGSGGAANRSCRGRRISAERHFVPEQLLNPALVHEDQHQVDGLRAGLESPAPLFEGQEHRRTPAGPLPAAHHATAVFAAEDERALLQRGDHANARRLCPQIAGNVVVWRGVQLLQHRCRVVQSVRLIRRTLTGPYQEKHRQHPHPAHATTSSSPPQQGCCRDCPPSHPSRTPNAPGDKGPLGGSIVRAAAHARRHARADRVVMLSSGRQHRVSRMTSVDLLLTQLDQAYDRHSWHGTNLRGSIRGVSPREAAWRPQPGRHNIHEIVVHAAYWKYAARRRLAREKRGSFPVTGSNWFSREAADADVWRADLQLLEDCHRTLRQIVSELAPTALTRSVGRSLSVLSLVSGVIAHDLYHAGQIQLIKRMHDAAIHGDRHR